MVALPKKTRTFLSLLIVFHLSIVFIVLGSNNYFGVSELQRRLNDFLAIYAQSLNLAPVDIDYSLAKSSGEDHFLEVHVERTSGADADSPEVFRYPPADAGRFSANAKRHREYASVLALFAQNEDSEMCAEIAKSIGTHVLTKTNSQRGFLRSWRHMAKFMDAGDVDDWSRGFFEMNYEADIWLHQGEAEVLKRTEAREVAPPTTKK